MGINTQPMVGEKKTVEILDGVYADKMTARDLFAACALAGLLMGGYSAEQTTEATVATAFDLADSMIRLRNQ